MLKNSSTLMTETETLSRQRRWQLLQKQMGNCPLCGKVSDSGSYCLPCTIKRRERQRKKFGAKRRYNAASYRAAFKLAAAINVKTLPDGVFDLRDQAIGRTEDRLVLQDASQLTLADHAV